MRENANEALAATVAGFTRSDCWACGADLGGERTAENMSALRCPRCLPGAPGLKVWHNGYDWYVASDREHLAELVRRTTGLELDHPDAEGDGWELWPAEKQIAIHMEDAPEGAEPPSHLPETWIELEGAGMLCSTEW